MKIMQIMRKIHLWLGLLFSIVLLVEGITGVMVAEPGWFGQQAYEHRSEGQSKLHGVTPPVPGAGEVKRNPREAAGDSTIIGTAKALHEGKVGTLNLRWLIALSGIVLVVLTVTGLYLAIPYFRRWLTAIAR